MTEQKRVFASRIARLSASPIREILKVLERREMISFAGGLPANETFPDLRGFNAPTNALQYGPTEGDWPLRSLIANKLCNLHLEVSPEQVIVLSGSQQGIDLVAKLMIDRGTRVAVETPTYLAALQVFSLFGAQFVPFAPSNLDQFAVTTKAPSMLYVNPTFQNPTGHCYTAKQRESLAEVCDSRGILLFEDDPYRDLAYGEACTKPICSYANSNHWIYQSSFSKTFAPGLRLGFLVCSRPLIEYVTHLKQAADQHSNRLSQHLIYQQLTNANNATRLTELVETYRVKRDLFNHYLEMHLGEYAQWVVPDGGLFFWLRLKTDLIIDTRQLLEQTLERNVAFMPGEPFFPNNNDAAVSQLRLNFSLASEREMDKGLAILGKTISNFRKENFLSRLTEHA